MLSSRPITLIDCTRTQRTMCCTDPSCRAMRMHAIIIGLRAQQFSDRLGIPAASGSNLLIRQTAFQQSGGFDIRLSTNEDSEIAWRIQRLGFRVAFAPDLIVYARDHRRLQRGTLRKTLHSIVRCSLLYCNLMPDRWRGGDWGYWSEKSPINSERRVGEIHQAESLQTH